MFLQRILYRRTPSKHASISSLTNPTNNKDRKVYPSTISAIQGLENGASILVGGFGPCGLPENLLRAVKTKNIQDLHLVSNNFRIDPSALIIHQML
jgi:Coenzyme A transferase